MLKNFGRGLWRVIKSRWFMRLGISLALVAFVVGVAAGLNYYINTPSTSTITASAVAPTPKPPGKVVLQGAYANFDYTEDFKPVKSDPPVPPQLMNYNFVSHKTENVLLSIQIMSLPTGNINDNGSYLFRKLYPNRYQQTTKTINGQTVYIMADVTSSTFNNVAFFSQGQKIASVSLDGGSPMDADNLDQSLSDIVSSWQWHN